MFSPGGFKEPRAWLPYAIDNGKFSVWSAGKQWIESEFFALLDRCRLSQFKPMWITVPDEVANVHATESLFYLYETRLREYGWPLAYVVQDGATESRVPKSADIVFVGGTTKWKWQNAKRFCESFSRVHVGRVNWVDKLEYCESIGAESCDGTGFFRGGPDSIQALQLVDFISGHRRENEQRRLFEAQVGGEINRPQVDEARPRHTLD
jgi:hypothetical protein